MAENSTAGYYDEQASKFAQKAADWDKQADSTSSSGDREKFRRLAQEHRDNAILAFENAKLAAGKNPG